MTKLEEEFGPAAKFIERYANIKIDVPEALIPVFEPLVEYGVWNLPWFNQSMAFYKKAWYPASLDSLWPDAQPNFIKIGWDKWYGQYLTKKVGKGPSLPANKDEENFEEFNKIAKQVRGFETVEEVIESGLIAKLCGLYFVDNSGSDFYATLCYGSKAEMEDENWTDEEPIWKLAHFFIPPTELLKMLDTNMPSNAHRSFNGWHKGAYGELYGKNEAKYFTIKDLTRPIFDEIIVGLVSKWGERKPIKTLAHNNHKLPYPSPDGDLNCEICQELIEEREILCKELAQRTRHPGADTIPYLQRNLSSSSLRDTRRWLAEQEEYLENGKQLQEEFNYEVYQALPTLKDPVVEEVVAFVSRLTKLGVSPNKAAETATKLIKLA